MTNKTIDALFLEDVKAMVERRFDDGHLGDFIEIHADQVLDFIAQKLGSIEEPNYFDAIKTFHVLYQD